MKASKQTCGQDSGKSPSKVNKTFLLREAVGSLQLELFRFMLKMDPGEGPQGPALPQQRVEWLHL